MDHDLESDNSVDIGHIKLPEFGLSNPRLWFAQAEAVFESRRITTQRSKYNNIVGNLPTSVAAEVADLIYNRPNVNPYDSLKSAIISRTAASDEKNLRKLLSGIELGDHTPSQLLRKLTELQGKNAVDEAIMKELWQQRLPPDVRKILAVIEKDYTLEKLSTIADQVYENCKPSLVSSVQHPNSSSPGVEQQLTMLQNKFTELSIQIQALTKGHTRSSRNSTPHRSRSRSRPPREKTDLCYYHRRFGAKAIRCTRPCSFIQPTAHQGNDNARQ